MNGCTQTAIKNLDPKYNMDVMREFEKTLN